MQLSKTVGRHLILAFDYLLSAGETVSLRLAKL
jgi:hypothetical protein